MPCPPECLDGEAHASAAYTLKSDVWQLGALLFTLATGRSYRRSGRQLKYLAASYSAAVASISASDAS